MNRKQFLTKLGLVAGVAVVAPKAILAVKEDDNDSTRDAQWRHTSFTNDDIMRFKEYLCSESEASRVFNDAIEMQERAWDDEIKEIYFGRG